MVSTTLVLLFLAAVLPAGAPKTPMQASDISTITVQGNGQVQVAPDEATVRLGVTRQAESAQDVQEQVNAVAQAMLEGITRLGIDRSQIQSSTLTLYPVYSAPPRSDTTVEPKIVGYR